MKAGLPGHPHSNLHTGDWLLLTELPCLYVGLGMVVTTLRPHLSEAAALNSWGNLFSWNLPPASYLLTF